MGTVSKVALSILDGLARKKIDDVKDPKIKEFLSGVWGDLKVEIPDLYDVLLEPAETILTGKYATQTKKIMGDLKEDVLAFKRKELDKAEFEEIVWRRKRSIFALYKAQQANDAQIKKDKILSAAQTAVEILIKYGIPFIMAIV